MNWDVNLVRHVLDDSFYGSNRWTYRPIADINRLFNDARVTDINYTAEAVNDTYVVSVDVPGVKHDAIDLSIDDRTMSLKWRRGDAERAAKFTIPRRYDCSAPHACLVDGVLTVTFSMSPELKPKKIDIEVKN